MIYMTKPCPAQVSNSEQEGGAGVVTMDEGPTIHTTCGRSRDRIPEQKLKTEREKMKSEGSKANKEKNKYEVDHCGPAENGHFGGVKMGLGGRKQTGFVCGTISTWENCVGFPSTSLPWLGLGFYSCEYK
jgi:hypothetical protein